MIFKASASSINVASEPDCKMHFTISSDCPETDKPGPAIMQSAHIHHFVSSSQLLFLSLYVSHIDSGTSVRSAFLLFSCVKTLTSPQPLLYADCADINAAPPILLLPATISTFPLVPLLPSASLSGIVRISFFSIILA